MVTGWPDHTKRAFLEQQFGCQTLDWNRNYPDARREIILVDGEPAGRLYQDHFAADRDLRVVDIALLPAFRNRGVATRIFSDLFREADHLGWRVSIHVEQNNPAKNLYTRLGFVPVSHHGIYILMQRPASDATPIAPRS